MKKLHSLALEQKEDAIYVYGEGFTKAANIFTLDVFRLIENYFFIIENSYFYKDLNIPIKQI